MHNDDFSSLRPMKRFIISSSAGILLVLVFSVAQAQYVKSDSANGNVYYAYGIPDSVLAEGPPDGLFAEIPNSSTAFLDMGFRRTATSGWLPILPKAQLKIYAVNSKGDTNAAASVQFIKYSPQGGQLYNSSYYTANAGVTTINVPDSTYDIVEFTLYGGGTLQGAPPLLLDGITLFQDFTNLSVSSEMQLPTAGLTGNYPNPFYTGRGTVVNATFLHPGTATIVLYDALGREVSRSELGHVVAGTYSQFMNPPGIGMYFARLLLNGAPFGPILKLTSVR
jgi:hypothetical protein